MTMKKKKTLKRLYSFSDNIIYYLMTPFLIHLYYIAYSSIISMNNNMIYEFSLVKDEHHYKFHLTIIILFLKNKKLCIIL